MRGMFFLAAVMLFMPVIGQTIGCVVVGVQFNQGCEGRLKRAADANTVEIAKTELRAALDYMDGNDLTKGRSNILWYTPQHDVEFWYNNIKSAHTELEEFPTDADSLTTSNQLMKLRETLLDEGGESVSVTLPPNITVYPSQTMWCFGWCLTVVLACVGFVCGCFAFTD